MEKIAIFGKIDQIQSTLACLCRSASNKVIKTVYGLLKGGENYVR